MKKWLGRLVFVACVVGALANTSCVSALNATIPSDGFTIHRDIVYGDKSRQMLDIYVPDALKKPAKVVLFFYGGSWQYGSKSDYLFVGQALASKGYIAVVADYRLYPQVKYPAFVQDGADALAWVHGNIGTYNGDAQNIFLAGHSAGAYIAMMLTANDRFIKEAGGKTEWIAGTIGVAGPYDFLPFTDAKIIDTFSTDEDALTQPITFVNRILPPIVLITGSEDDTVSPENSRRVAERLKALRSPITLKEYEDVGHISIIVSIAERLRFTSPLLSDIDAFIKANSR